METVEIIIKIPRSELEYAKKGYTKAKADVVYRAIENGTVLPKGHGRLIDADAVTKDVNAFICAFSMYTDNMGKYNIVCAASTVIEADKDGDADG